MGRPVKNVRNVTDLGVYGVSVGNGMYSKGVQVLNTRISFCTLKGQGMGLRYIYCLFCFFPLCIYGTTVCEVALTALSKSDGEHRTLDITKALIEEGRRQVKANTNPENPYEGMVTGENASDPKSVMITPGQDNVVFMDLPTSTATPWSQLSADERQFLVRELSSLFQSGNYDRQDSEDGHTQIIAGLRKKEMKLIGEMDASDGYPQVGLSGIRMLSEASKGEHGEGGSIGVCRHATCGFVGLLLELGVPPKNLRTVSGTKPNSKDGHIWVQYRVDDKSPWEDTDPTAHGDVSHALMSVILGNTRKPTQIYTENQQVEPLDKMLREAGFSIPARASEGDAIERIRQSLGTLLEEQN